MRSLWRSIGWIPLALAVLPATWGCATGSSDGSAAPAADTRERTSDFNGDASALIPSVSAEIHPEVETVLIVRWTQTLDTTATRIKYTFEDDEWLETPAVARFAGEHEAVLLGLPEATGVVFYFEVELPRGAPDGGTADGDAADAGEWDGGLLESTRFRATTGLVPSKMPRPTVLGFNPERASSARWMLGTVEDTPAPNRYYGGTFWVYIIDRKGRIVWYYADHGANPCMAYPRVARDGSHLYVEKRMFYGDEGYRPRVVRMTLDRRQFQEIPLPGLDDCIDVTDDGAILFNEWDDEGDAFLKERGADGDVRKIWNCRKWASDLGVAGKKNHCYSNTVSWHPTSDTVLMSMPYLNTVVEIDRKTGRLVSQFGDASGSYRFEPDTWTLEFNHFPSITKEGTLLVSTHAPGHDDKNTVGEHRIAEFVIDRAGRRLVEKWVYGEGLLDWPKYKGEASRLENGNTLVNYGTGGVIREVTPAKETAWHVKWDADFEDDRFNKMVGHTILIDDLYSLCRGW